MIWRSMSADCALECGATVGYLSKRVISHMHETVGCGPKGSLSAATDDCGNLFSTDRQ